MKWSLALLLLLLTANARADKAPSPPDVAAKPVAAEAAKPVAAAPAPVPAAPAPVPDKEGFVPVTDADLQKAKFDESVPAPELIAGAYGFIFAALALFAFRIGRRAHRIEGEMNDLRARIEKRLATKSV